MKFDEWIQAILIANDLANLLESEPGQEDAVLFLHASVLLSFYKSFMALGLNDRAVFTHQGEPPPPPANLFAGKAHKAKPREPDF